jgi:hypothetical protein
MKIDSRCLSRFLSGKVGKTIGKNTIGLLLEQANRNHADSAEAALGFMEPEESENPETDSAEIIVTVAIKRIGGPE